MLDVSVEGMTCEHCVRAVTQALSTVPGVESVTVDLAAGQVHVTGSPDLATVHDAIAAEGYVVASSTFPPEKD